MQRNIEYTELSGKQLSSLLLSQALKTKKRNAETISSAHEKIRAGYCLKTDLTVAEKACIFDNFPEASVIRVESAGLHGGRHYSIHDLLGHSVRGWVYVVTNITRFNEFMSSKLERDFRNKNPGADSRIRASFTSFMHENNLHWSMCCKKRNSSGDYRLAAPGTDSSQRELFGERRSNIPKLKHLKLNGGFLTEKQFHVFDLRSRGYSQQEIARALDISRTRVASLEKRAIKQIERARQTLKIYELAQKRQHKVTIPVGTRLQKIPIVVLQEADPFHVHLQASMVDILNLVKANRQNHLMGGKTSKEIVFSFDERGKLSLL